jgi:transcriptional regulator with XRE-family HTH domain
MLAEQVLAALRAAVEAAPSQSQLGRDLHLSQATINAYLNGRRKSGNMTLATFERLLPRLGLRVVTVGRPCGRCAAIDDAGLDLATRITALSEVQRAALVGRLEAYEEQKPQSAPRHRAAGA